MDVSPTQVRRLSAAQRDLLIRHVAQAVPVVHRSVEDHLQTGLSRRVLIGLGFITGVPFHDGGWVTRPRKTVSRNRGRANRPIATKITSAGREAAAILLGDYADALVQAGLMEQEDRPLDVAMRLKAQSQPRIVEVLTEVLPIPHKRA